MIFRSLAKCSTDSYACRSNPDFTVWDADELENFHSLRDVFHLVPKTVFREWIMWRMPHVLGYDASMSLGVMQYKGILCSLSFRQKDIKAGSAAPVNIPSAGFSYLLLCDAYVDRLEVSSLDAIGQ